MFDALIRGKGSDMGLAATDKNGKCHYSENTFSHEYFVLQELFSCSFSTMLVHQGALEASCCSLIHTYGHAT